MAVRKGIYQAQNSTFINVMSYPIILVLVQGLVVFLSNSWLVSPGDVYREGNHL